MRSMFHLAIRIILIVYSSRVQLAGAGFSIRVLDSMNTATIAVG